MFKHTNLFVRTLVAVATLIVVVVPASEASADGRTDPPGRPDGNHCVAEWGADYNELWNVPEQFLTRECRQTTSGEHWRPFGPPWIVNSWNESFPEGYVPTGDTPLEDFAMKLTAVKVIVDGGTSQERTYVVPGSEALRTDVSLDEFEPGMPALPMAVTMPRMKPVSVGEHTRQVIWVLSARHCDGLAPNEDNCLPAGETPMIERPFTVVKP